MVPCKQSSAAANEWQSNSETIVSPTQIGNANVDMTLADMLAKKYCRCQIDFGEFLYMHYYKHGKADEVGSCSLSCMPWDMVTANAI